MFIRAVRPSARPLNRFFRALAAAVLAAGVLTACAGISRQELNSLGSGISHAKVDFKEISDYGHRARAAYSSEPQIRAAYPKTVRVAEAGSTGVRYFLERDEAAAVQYLTIRGTANKRNLHEDMDSHLMADRRSGIPVHAGFDEDAQAVYQDVKPHLRKGYRTHLSGHSLGGAVAALVAIYAIEDGYGVERIVTFGQPRFTTESGVPRLSSLPLLRVVDENDVVPMLPPAMKNKVHGSYEHVGPEVILLDGPHYVYLPSHDANRIAIGEFWRSIGIADLQDHKMDNYLRRLAAKTKGAVEVSYDEREKYVTRPPAKSAAAN